MLSLFLIDRLCRLISIFRPGLDAFNSRVRTFGYSLLVRVTRNNLKKKKK